nr:hypothetical protein CFP56_25325 [Quercus suber]
MGPDSDDQRPMRSLAELGSSSTEALAVVGSIRSLMLFRYSFKTKTDLAQTKMKAPPNSYLYGPYQALSSSNPLLQASFMGIAICNGISGNKGFTCKMGLGQLNSSPIGARNQRKFASNPSPIQIRIAACTSQTLQREYFAAEDANE